MTQGGSTIDGAMMTCFRNSRAQRKPYGKAETHLQGACLPSTSHLEGVWRESGPMCLSSTSHLEGSHRGLARLYS
jgi:hypothetical protein